MKSSNFIKFCFILVFSSMLLLSCKGKESATETMVLSFGTQENPGHPMYAGYEAFAEKLAEISGGTMTVEIFPSSQLGDSKSTFDQVTTGELDMSTSGYPDMSYLIAELALIGQAYVIRDYDHLLKIVYESDYGKKMYDEFKKHKVELASLWYGGMRQTTSNKPLNSIDDFKGLKLRVPNVQFLLDYAKATGSIPSPVAFAELYLALQTDQVQAQENPLSTIEGNKLYEVQKYIAMTSHFVASTAIFVSDETLAKFNDEQLAWFNEALEYGRNVCNDLIFTEETELIAKFEADGVTITYPPLEPFRAAMLPYYAKLEEQFGEGSISSLMEIK